MRWPALSRRPIAMPRTMPTLAAIFTGRSSVLPRTTSCTSIASHTASAGARDGFAIKPTTARADDATEVAAVVGS